MSTDSKQSISQYTEERNEEKCQLKIKTKILDKRLHFILIFFVQSEYTQY